MITIKILGNRYQIPESMKDVKLSRYVQFLDFLDAAMPQWLQDIQNMEDDEERNEAMRTISKKQEISLLDFYAYEVEFWSGCPYADIRKHPINEIAGIWGFIRERMTLQEDKQFCAFLCDGVVYHLPKRFMTESTLEDYAEANAYEQQLEKVMNGQYKALFYIAAIICRTSEEEGFDDYSQEHRAALFTDHLTAYDAFQIGFFLQRQNNKLQKDFQIYMTSQTLSILKQDTTN